jgi:hypothetical protein
MLIWYQVGLLSLISLRGVDDFVDFEIFDLLNKNVYNTIKSNFPNILHNQIKFS